MELVWVLWGILTTLNVGLLGFSAYNLKKTERLLAKVEGAVEVDGELLEANTALLNEMRNLVIKGEDND